LPESILRLQRREYFRATALVSQPITGRIALETEQGINRQTMRGIDISLGGVALLAGSTLETVKVGDVFAKAELNLPGVGEITADLEVLNIRPQHSGGHLCSRFGCRFVNLAPAMASKVQRYINRLELERAHRI
jgi:c-di-GMP-binding flagellar brake protein YcgR